MVRRRSQDFVPRLLQAATRVFARKGLKGARMGDIAREMGVAHGSLYNYVESKDALFLLLIERLGNPEPPVDLTFPVKTPSMRAIAQQLRHRVESVWPLPTLDAALTRRHPKDPTGELEAIVRELYLRTEESREGAMILERSALDMPEICQLFLEQVLQRLFDRMTRYVTARMQEGSFQATDPGVAARFIIETVTSFARHRAFDPNPLPHDDRTIREAIVALVTRSLIPPVSGHTRRRQAVARPRK